MQGCLRHAQAMGALPRSQCHQVGAARAGMRCARLSLVHLRDLEGVVVAVHKRRVGVQRLLLKGPAGERVTNGKAHALWSVSRGAGRHSPT